MYASLAQSSCCFGLFASLFFNVFHNFYMILYFQHIDRGVSRLVMHGFPHSLTVALAFTFTCKHTIKQKAKTMAKQTRSDSHRRWKTNPLSAHYEDNVHLIATICACILYVFIGAVSVVLFSLTRFGRSIIIWIDRRHHCHRQRPCLACLVLVDVSVQKHIVWRRHFHPPKHLNWLRIMMNVWLLRLKNATVFT